MAESGAAGAAQASGPGQGEGQSQQTAQQTQTQGQESQQAQGQPDGEGVEKTEDAQKEVTRHKYHDRLSKHFPDRKFESPEDYDAATDDYLSYLETYRNRGDEANRQLMDLFDSEPDVAEAISESVNKGVPFRVAWAKHFGAEDISLDESDKYYSDFDANKKARAERITKQKAERESFDKNVKESERVLAGFAKENKMSNEDVKNVLDQFNVYYQEIKSGKLTPDSLNMILRGIQFEKAIQDAADSATLKAKNEKISAEMAKETPRGDGLPRPNKGGEVPERRERSPIDDYVDRAKHNDVYQGLKK